MFKASLAVFASLKVTKAVEEVEYEDSGRDRASSRSTVR